MERSIFLLKTKSSSEALETSPEISVWLLEASHPSPDLSRQAKQVRGHPRLFTSRAPRCFQALYVSLLLPRGPTQCPLSLACYPHPSGAPFTVAALLTSPRGDCPHFPAGAASASAGTCPHPRRGWESVAGKSYGFAEPYRLSSGDAGMGRGKCVSSHEGTRVAVGTTGTSFFGLRLSSSQHPGQACCFTRILSEAALFTRVEAMTR